MGTCRNRVGRLPNALHYWLDSGGCGGGGGDEVEVGGSDRKHTHERTQSNTINIIVLY